MRTIVLAAAAVLLMAGPALAQGYIPPGCNQRGIPDCGPFTPEANGAFAGGGLVLESPGGYPPPRAVTPLPPMPVSPPETGY